MTYQTQIQCCLKSTHIREDDIDKLVLERVLMLAHRLLRRSNNKTKLRNVLYLLMGRLQFTVAVIRLS